MKYEKLKCSCEFKVLKNKKLYCKTHEQALMYVYVVNGEHRYVCQVGEDELCTQIVDGKGEHHGNL